MTRLEQWRRRWVRCQLESRPARENHWLRHPITVPKNMTDDDGESCSGADDEGGSAPIRKCDEGNNSKKSLRYGESLRTKMSHNGDESLPTTVSHRRRGGGAGDGEESLVTSTRTGQEDESPATKMIYWRRWWTNDDDDSPATSTSFEQRVWIADDEVTKDEN